MSPRRDIKDGNPGPLHEVALCGGVIGQVVDDDTCVSKDGVYTRPRLKNVLGSRGIRDLVEGPGKCDDRGSRVDPGMCRVGHPYLPR